MSDMQDTFRALSTSIQGLPKDWKRPSGRPHHTWLHMIEADLQPRIEFSTEACRKSRTAKAARGDSYAPVWGTPVIRDDDDDEHVIRKWLKTFLTTNCNARNRQYDAFTA